MATAVADVSGLIEAASSPDPTPITPVTEEPIVETQETAPEVTQGGEDQEKVTPDQKVNARSNPDAIRKALKALRDSSPEHAPTARDLNDIVGRYQAITKIFPKVADAQQAKFLLDSVGGGEGLTTLQNTIKSVNETDALLYAGDARVLDSILDDMKAAGKQDAFGKLASPFLDKLRATDEKAYFSALRPHFFQGIQDSGLPDVLDSLEAALGNQVDGKPSPNLDNVKALVSEMRKWYEKLSSNATPAKNPELDADRQAFAKEKSEFQTQKQKAFQAEVNTEWNRANNEVLGKALKPYLTLAFAKNWTDATKQSVGREIMSTFMSELSGDKAYQAQMDALWSQPKPDKSKILSFHRSKLDLIGKQVVKNVLDTRYPGLTSVKGAPVAPKAAAQPVAQPTGKPMFQTAKPTHDQIDWARDPNGLLFTSGRFYDKRGNFRTWNPKYK